MVAFSAPAPLGPLTIPDDPIPLAGWRVQGDPDAPVGLLEFGDFSCRFSGRFARDVLPRLRIEFIGDGRLLFGLRHLPAAARPQSMEAATASECAGEHGRFWDFHDLMYQHQGSAASIVFSDWSAEFGIHETALDSCRASGIEAKVRGDREAAASLGVVTTPVFFLGKVRNASLLVERVIRGAQPYEQFKCDDPEGGWVAWAAEGTCANDYESDCAEACFECYSHYPKAIEQGQCNNGTGVYGADCGCHIVK